MHWHHHVRHQRLQHRNRVLDRSVRNRRRHFTGRNSRYFDRNVDAVVQSTGHAPAVAPDLVRRARTARARVPEPSAWTRIHRRNELELRWKDALPCSARHVNGAGFQRLAQHFNCPIHGARIIRLPNNRFRAELTDEIPPVRDANGKVDIAATMQTIMTVIEGWIRENPEQWLWLHRRWRPEDVVKAR